MNLELIGEMVSFLKDLMIYSSYDRFNLYNKKFFEELLEKPLDEKYEHVNFLIKNNMVFLWEIKKL